MDLTPEQREDFAQAVNKAVDIMFEIDRLNAEKKDLADHCKDVHGIPTKKFNKSAKIIHDNSLVSEKEFFDSVIEIVEELSE